MPMKRRLISAIMGASLVVALSASAVLAGEATGNGKSLHVDGPGTWGPGLPAAPFWAFSGPEDSQFAPGGSKGVPGLAQSWAEIPKAARAAFPAAMPPGRAGTPNSGPPAEPESDPSVMTMRLVP